MKINPKQLEKAMKQMGIKQDQIEATEVIIKSGEMEIVISNPQVMKVNMMGQESFQITGDVSERSAEKFSKDDIKLIIEQTGASEELAKKTLEETGDIASAILKLKERQ